MKDNGRLALAAGSPELDARDGPAVERVAGRDDGRLAGVRRLQVLEELEVVGVAVVRVEPRGVGRPGCDCVSFSAVRRTDTADIPAYVLNVFCSSIDSPRFSCMTSAFIPAVAASNAATCAGGMTISECPPALGAPIHVVRSSFSMMLLTLATSCPTDRRTTLYPS